MCLRPCQLTKDKALGDLLSFTRLQKHVHSGKNGVEEGRTHARLSARPRARPPHSSANGGWGLVS